jgi:crossover junction endodeoxyribonuclease RuvC
MRGASENPEAPSGIVLGIDPGTVVVGYGAVRATASGLELVTAGVLRPRRQAPVPERLGEIGAGLDELLRDIGPALVVVEEAFVSRNVQSALRIGEGRGVALASATRFGARVVQMPPAVAKKTLVGNGAAPKEQVAGMVGRLLGVARESVALDATDALALALAHLMRPRTLRVR